MNLQSTLSFVFEHSLAVGLIALALVAAFCYRHAGLLKRRERARHLERQKWPRHAAAVIGRRISLKSTGRRLRIDLNWTFNRDGGWIYPPPPYGHPRVRYYLTLENGATKKAVEVEVSRVEFTLYGEAGSTVEYRAGRYRDQDASVPETCLVAA